MSMLCPKCHSLMHAYERNGVVVDQCTECRGIFLDRGELEHLVEAEARFNRASSPPPARTPTVPARRRLSPTGPTRTPRPPLRRRATRPPDIPLPTARPCPPPGAAPGRSPMADLSTIASIADRVSGQEQGKKKGKKGSKSFIDGLFG